MYKHDFDILSFLGGILFAGIGFVFLFAEQRWSDIDTRWVGPALLVLAGVVILLSAIRSPDDRLAPVGSGSGGSIVERGSPRGDADDAAPGAAKREFPPEPEGEGA
jgi:hypothetical protein